MLNEKLGACALNEQMSCEGPDGFFWTGSRQPVWPYKSQMLFSTELRKRDRTVV